MWKICSELDAYGLYVVVSGLELCYWQGNLQPAETPALVFRYRHGRLKMADGITASGLT